MREVKMINFGRNFGKVLVRALSGYLTAKLGYLRQPDNALN